MANPAANPARLDIARDICPMTFVKTRVAYDRLAAGQTLTVRLATKESLASVTGGITECGGVVVRVQELAGGIHEVHVQRPPRFPLRTAQ